MSIFSELSVLASYVGPTTTVVGSSFEKDQTTKKRKFSEDKAKENAKNAGMTTVAGSITSSLHNCAANHTLRNAQLYVESLNEEQLYEFVQLIEEKENEFTINGATYDLAQVDPVDSATETIRIKDVKILGKNL